MNPENNSQQNPQGNSLGGQQFVNYGNNTQSGIQNSTQPNPTVNTVIPPRPTPVTPVSSVYVNRNDYIPKKSHKGLFAFLFILIIIILAIAYGAYAWVLHPENTIQSIINNIDSAKIISTNTKIAMKSDSGSTDVTTLMINLDKTNANAIKTQAVVDVGSEKYPIGLELRYIDQTLYAEITSYPQEYAGFIKGFANKWYSLSTKAFTSTTKSPQQFSAQKWYQDLISSGVFTGIHFSGVTWGSNGPVRNYTVDVNPEIFNKNNTSGYEQKLSQSSVPYAGVASSYAGKLAESVKFSPLTLTVNMFSGSLEQLSFSVTSNDPKQPQVDVVFKYDGSKSEIAIDVPVGAQPLDALLSGFLNPAPVQMSTSSPLRTTTTKAKK